MKIKVKVIGKDIALGAKQNNMRCPIALAMNRSLKKKYKSFAEADVGSRTAFIYIHNKESPSDWETIGIQYNIYMPPEATRVVHDFDRGIPVKPSTFTFEGTKVKVGS
jgi:hypothetical protein